MVTRYVDAVISARPTLDKILKDLSPATRALVGLLRLQARGLWPLGREFFRDAVLCHDGLVRSLRVMDFLAKVGLEEFSTACTPHIPGKRHHLHHIDRITEPLLGCYTDREIAELVPDGDETCCGRELAEVRVSNRRKKLTGARKGGRTGKPGRPRKVREK